MTGEGGARLAQHSLYIRGGSTMFSQHASLRYTLFLVSICVTVISFTATIAEADSYWRTVINNAVVVADTAHRDATPSQEAERIGQNWDKYNDQRAQAHQTSVPQAQLNHLFPAFSYTPDMVGTSIATSFIFIDPITRNPTTPGFDVAAVSYQALLNPADLNPSQLATMNDGVVESVVRANLTPLGIVTNPANNFGGTFQLRGFEPIILAFPLNAQGSEITGEGSAAFVSTYLVPEPATWQLLLAGLIVALISTWLKVRLPNS